MSKIKYPATKDTTTKEKILAAALEASSHTEYHYCLVDNIAKIAGVAKGTVYLYFKSKDELYVAVIEKVLHEMSLVVAAAAKQKKSATVLLRTMLDQLYPLVDRQGHMLKMLTHETHHSSLALQKRVYNAYGSFFASLRRIITKGIAAKQIKKYPASLIGVMLIAFLNAATHHKNKFAHETHLITPHTIAELVLHGIAAK